MKRLVELFCSWEGQEPQHIERLAGAGSNRSYYRLTDCDGQTVIGVIGTNVEENRAFVSLANHFASKDLPVPLVLVVSDDEMCYLQTDLGSTSLFDCLRKGRESGGEYSEEERRLLHKVIQMLPRLQVEGADGLDFSCCYPQAEFDFQGAMFDLNYFKYCFLKPSGVEFNEVKLEDDFTTLAHKLTSYNSTTFLYRDFQARNVMISSNGEPYFIDFQGGRRGPIYYDLASFLWQASARYPADLRAELIDDYYETLSTLTDVPPRAEFDESLWLFVLFRLLQVLGAYGYRGYFERKPHFINSIPPAIENLREILRDRKLLKPYPYLKWVLSELASLPKYDTRKEEGGKRNEEGETRKEENIAHGSSLVVRIYSFSYKKGIPEDTSGNGGGYVFDCRSTHNPGRYEPYKKFTGLDECVIKFLEDDGEILTFLESVYRLADAHVQRYIERGFTSLMFSFGCTGGQHRSVYSAQHLAEHISKKFGVEVRLCHREQNIHQVFPCKSL